MKVGKFSIVIAAVIGIMIALVIVPGLKNWNGDQDPFGGANLNVEYSKQHLVRSQNGSLAAARGELLVIKNDGSASYTEVVGTQLEQRAFTPAAADIRLLRELILGTGFIQIPDSDYAQKEGIGNFTKYTLSLKTDAGGTARSKTISWVDPESSSRPVPPIITNVGSRLDGIIASSSKT